jgi:hypothetical protein
VTFGDERIANAKGSARLLLNAAATGAAPEQWLTASPQLRAERAAIETWLQAGGRAYGFTTLLGHLADVADDTHPGDSRRGPREADLLRSHLVAASHLVRLSPVATRCVIGAKLQQLSMGGSGVGPGTYGAFAAAWGSPPALELPLDASYSCGDVVPGAWLLDQIVDAEHLEQGDVIAGINGNHVSTGIAVLALGLGIDAAQALLSWLRSYRRSAMGSDRSQPPVSLRDGGSSEVVLTDAVADCERALDRRLAISAANPRFIVDDAGAVSVRSTSAFVDHALSSALISLRTALLLTSHHLVALHSELERTHGSAGSLSLQYPKVLGALQSRLVQRFGGGPPQLRPVASESDGLEDTADHSLHLAIDITEVAPALRAMLDVAGEHVERLGLDATVATGAPTWPGPGECDGQTAIPASTLLAVRQQGLLG